MKNFFLIFFVLIPLLNFSQPNTEVFLFDLRLENGTYQLSNVKNISENEGYDNQPSFLDNNTLLYSGTRNGQTDIVKYTITTDEKQWICNTEGSEYSPLKIPNQDAVSAIRLNKDGTQILRKYSLKNGESDVLVDEIVIGYHVWLKEDILVSSVLEENYLTLYVSNLSENKNYKHQTKIGRSLHVIPDSNIISYISKEKDSIWEIKSLDSSTRETKIVFETLSKSEDMCWTPNGDILMANNGVLYKMNPKLNDHWAEIADMANFGITNITRLAVSTDGSKLAIVGEPININLKPTLENISWISGNWKGEAFGGFTEENWSEPSGGSMMATFKLINNDKVSFYEIEIIREIDNTLLLQLKHFNNDLKGWETKDETVDFPLIEITPNKVIFEGMSFEKISENEMNVYVETHQKDGSIKTVKFNYKK